MKQHYVELMADSIVGIDPISGGQYSRQVSIGLQMGREQQRAAVLNILGGMVEQDAFDWLRSEFPAWFAKATGEQA